MQFPVSKHNRRNFPYDKPPQQEFKIRSLQEEGANSRPGKGEICLAHPG